MKYLILGNGFLGNRLKGYLGKDAAISKSYHHSSHRDWGVFNNYDVIINTIAKTDIDWCEKNRLEALEVNALLARTIADWTKAYGKKYVFFSSACVFESKDLNDWKDENDTPNPQCWYSWTKVIAEYLILEVNPEALIIRPRLPISEFPHSRNTLNKLMKYDQINTNQESITVIEDMFPFLKKLVDDRAEGIFHLVNEGTISPSEMADLLNHPHKKVVKKEQDERLAKEGRAKRVTAYIKNTRTDSLPNVRDRIGDITKKFKSTYHGE